MLNVFDEAPEGLFSTPAEGLLRLLGGPSLIRIPGFSKPSLFISVLLHGNETSGWNAVSRLLRDRSQLPRDLLLFIGNVEAAASGKRVLPGQPDYNRIWRNYDGPEAALAKGVLDVLRQEPIFVGLDIHNNTGRNPHYSVLTELDAATKGLAYLFSDKAVYIEEPNTVLGVALREFCPATAVEVGPVGDPASDDRSYDLLQAYMALSEIPEDPGDALKLHRSVGRIHVMDEVEFDFTDDVPVARQQTEDLILTSGVEAVNFHEIPQGFRFGVSHKPLAETVRVLDPAHRDITAEFLETLHDGTIVLRKPAIPAMFTTDHAVIRQDCLCYLMEKIAS